MAGTLNTQSVAKLVKGNYYRVLFRAQDAGLLPTTLDYTRFVCVASSRTGSTLLTRSLAEHPGVRMYGEILRNYDCFADYVHEFRGTEALFQSEPSTFLDARVFRKYPRSVEAVGFKLLYRHAPREHPWGDEVWRYMLAQPQLSIIHLKRQNLLQVYVSKTVAGLSNEWIKYGASTAQQDQLTVDLDDMIAFFEWRRAAETDFDQRFAEFPILQVRYESLANDFDNEMARIQRFLGLEPVPVEPGTKQRAGKPLAEQIANYDAVVERLAGTEWADFIAT